MPTTFNFSTAEHGRANKQIALIWSVACVLLLAAMWGAVVFKIQSDPELLI
jgi:hypothetical protein